VLQHPQFTLTLLDPTSLPGSQVVGPLWSAFPAARRRLFHTAGAEEHLIAEVCGEAAMVAPLADGGVLEGTDVVVVTATPAPAAAAALLSWLRANPAAVLVDLTQPGLAPAESQPLLAAPPPGGREVRWFHLAAPALWAPGRVLMALAPLAPTDAALTLLLPAADFGEAGIEELARQAAARLSGRATDKPATLPGVLAFDAVPTAPARLGALRAQLTALFPRLPCRLAAAHVGVFHGNAAALTVRAASAADATRAAALLRGAPGIRLARRNEHPHLTVAVDTDEIVCADIESEGGWVTAWVFADAVRAGGAQVVADTVAAVRAS
jgi:hypothetical protein